MTDNEIVQTIRDSVGLELRGGDILDIIWAITTNPDLVMEIDRRYRDWCREMNETHTEK